MLFYLLRLNDLNDRCICFYVCLVLTLYVKSICSVPSRVSATENDVIVYDLKFESNPRRQKLFLFGNPLGEKGTVSLLQAISVNTTMVVLNLGYTSCYYDEIQFNTCLNRAGRRLLTEEPIPALWPFVLDHTRKVSQQSRGICSSADLLFYMIRHGPLLLELSNQ